MATKLEDLSSAPTKVKESTGYRVFTVCNTILMILISAAMLYPFLYLIAQSFSSENAIIKGLVSIIPVDFNLVTYKSVLGKGDFQMHYKNTFIYAIIGTTVSVFLTSILAYPLSKSELKLNSFFTKFVVFTMYFGGGMIPNYVLMNALGLRDTYSSFILPGMIGAYYVLLMKSFFANVPKELEEAAEIDGSNKFGVFFKIVIPLSKPIIATMVLFYMVGYWNNWFNAFLYLDSKSKWPVAYYLRQIISAAKSTADPGAMNEDTAQISANIKSCCMVLTAAPIVCIYPFVQKYFVQGMMMGGVKE